MNFFRPLLSPLRLLFMLPSMALAGTSLPPISPDAAFERPANRTVAMLGDSRTVLNWNTTALGEQIGPMFWLKLLTGQSFDHDFSQSFGVNGERLYQIRARLPQVLAGGAGTVVVLGGTNDGPNDPADPIGAIANLDYIVTTLLNAGKHVILIAETPRGDGAFDPTYRRSAGADLNWFMGLHNWCLAQRGRNKRLYVVDPWERWASPTATLGDVRSGLTYDALHYNQIGSYFLALSIRPIIDFLFPPRSIIPQSNADIFDETWNPRGILTPNPMMAGTGGPAVGGQSSNSWNLVNQNSAGLTVTGSKVTDANGLLWQQITVSGTPTSTNLIQFYADIPAGNLAKISTADNLESVAAVQVDPGVTGVSGVVLSTVAGVPGPNSTTIFTEAQSGIPSVGERAYDIPSPYAGIMRAPILQPPAGFTVLRTAFRITPRANVPMSITVRVRGIGAHKYL